MQRSSKAGLLPRGDERLPLYYRPSNSGEYPEQTVISIGRGCRLDLRNRVGHFRLFDFCNKIEAQYVPVLGWAMVNDSRMSERTPQSWH
jgi:hypothetical protein